MKTRLTKKLEKDVRKALDLSFNCCQGLFGDVYYERVEGPANMKHFVVEFARNPDFGNFVDSASLSRLHSKLQELEILPQSTQCLWLGFRKGLLTVWGSATELR